MSGWKWTTQVALVVALVIMAAGLFGMYQYADQNDLIFQPNSGGIFLNFLLWWALVKWTLDAAVWLKRRIVR